MVGYTKKKHVFFHGIHVVVRSMNNKMRIMPNAAPTAKPNATDNADVASIMIIDAMIPMMHGSVVSHPRNLCGLNTKCVTTVA